MEAAKRDIALAALRSDLLLWRTVLYILTWIALFVVEQAVVIASGKPTSPQTLIDSVFYVISCLLALFKLILVIALPYFDFPVANEVLRIQELIARKESERFDELCSEVNSLPTTTSHSSAYNTFVLDHS